MKVENVENSIYQENGKIASAAVKLKSANKIGRYNRLTDECSFGTVSFKGGDLSKKSWMLFRNVSDYMKEKSELTSALIAFIGTGAIAPFAIMCSPGKGKKKGEAEPTEEEKKHAKEKKFFQALRQPISAFLAFLFQMPTTLGIAKIFDYFAYKKPHKIFRDEAIGDLVPEKKYLKRQAKHVLKGNASSELNAAWSEEMKIAKDSDKITTELKNKIKQDYSEVGIELSEDKLNKKANNKGRRLKYITDKMADAKYNKLMEAKIESLKGKHFEIKDIDLVTSDYQDLAKHRFKEDFKAIEKNANLSIFDEFIKSMGFSNKKIKQLEDAQKSLAKEKGWELLKQDNPEIVHNEAERFKKFIQTRSANAQKIYGNKVFWITLLTNLGMVAISCTALNWLHPILADFVDGIKQAKKEEKARKMGNLDNKKVEVSA